MSRAQNRARRYSLVGDRARRSPASEVALELAPTPDDGGLRYGFTLNDLDAMAKSAVVADRSMAMDARARFDIAWSAIAEALYAADEPPSWQDLVRVGWQAIYHDVRDSYRQHGYREALGGGLESAPRFASYWAERRVTPSPEVPIVERYAMPPILASLTDKQRAVVGAVAAFEGDKVRAAAHLGMDDKALSYQLRTAREQCLALWLEGETPAKTKLRRLDRRQHRGPAPEHGTPAAAYRHRAARETPCELCAPILRQAELDKKDRRAEKGAA